MLDPTIKSPAMHLWHGSWHNCMDLILDPIMPLLEYLEGPRETWKDVSGRRGQPRRRHKAKNWWRQRSKRKNVKWEQRFSRDNIIQGIKILCDVKRSWNCNPNPTEVIRKSSTDFTVLSGRPRERMQSRE